MAFNKLIFEKWAKSHDIKYLLTYWRDNKKHNHLFNAKILTSMNRSEINYLINNGASYYEGSYKILLEEIPIRDITEYL